MNRFNKVHPIIRNCALTGFLSLAAACSPAPDSNLYFPADDAGWESISPEQAGWDSTALDAALDLAGERNSSAVLILHGGRIMAERYWEPREVTEGYTNMRQEVDADGHPVEEVASVQKSVVAVLTGIAQERGILSIDDSVSQYLGAGWSQASAEQEQVITIRHLMSMNSGLASNLEYEAPLGERWFYNTPAYHRIMQVLSTVTGIEANELTGAWLTERLGMDNSSWTIRSWSAANMNLGFSTNARDLARFGLMVQAKGTWDGEVIIADRDYLADMLAPSQQDNPAYGYLWWLNSEEVSRSPGAGRTRVEGRLIPSAPPDLVAAQGALDRKLYVVPSMNLIVVRLGAAAGGDPPRAFNEAFWQALMLAAP